MRAGRRGTADRAPLRRALSIVAVALVAGLAPAAAEAGTPRCAGAAGAGDPYYPTDGNGGYNVQHYALNLNYDPATDVLGGTGPDRGEGEAAAVPPQPRPGRPRGLGGRRRRQGGDLVSQRPGADDYATAPARRSSAIPRRGSLRRGARGVPAPDLLRAPNRVHHDLGRRHRSRTAGVGSRVVSGQRPPERQGVLLVRDRRPERLRGGRQRQAEGRARAPGRQCGVALGGTRADGLVSGHDRHRPLGRAPLANRVPGSRSTTPSTPTVTGDLRAQVDASLARQGEILDLLARGVRPVSVQHHRRDRRPRAPDPVRARDSDPAGVLALFWVDDQGNPTNADFVVVHELAHQWYGDSVALERWSDIWLSEGFATYAEWLWLEHEGRATPRQFFDAAYAAYPADDPLWSVVIGDPGPGASARRCRLRPGRDDACQPCGRRSATRRSSTLIRRWAKRKAGRHGYDRPVHLHGRASFRSSARRSVPDLAVHPREAAPPEPGAGPGEATVTRNRRQRAGGRLGREPARPASVRGLLSASRAPQLPGFTRTTSPMPAEAPKLET